MTINPIPADKKYHQIYTVDKDTAEVLYNLHYKEGATKIDYNINDPYGNIKYTYYWVSWRK